MWEFLRKANGRCGNCGAKTLKVDTTTRTLICQSCGAINKSSSIISLIALFPLITLNNLLFDNVSFPYNWLILIFAIAPITLFIFSELRVRVISTSDEEE